LRSKRKNVVNWIISPKLWRDSLSISTN
jgi:hypothetical protein